MTINEYIRTYWPIFVTIVTLAVGLYINDSIQNVRITALEVRQDRQATAIMTLNTQMTNVVTNFAALSSKVDAINENVTYIRNRIDRVTQ